MWYFFFSSRRRHTRSVSAFLLNRSSDLTFCRHRLRRQNVGYSNFSQPQSHLSFRVLLQYLVERRRVVTCLVSLDQPSRGRLGFVSFFIPELGPFLIVDRFFGRCRGLVCCEFVHCFAPWP